jgi:hypothetical protein
MKPERNMYGCLPCPKCGSVYRYPFNENGKNAIVCDDCGRRGPWDGEYSDNGYAVDETERWIKSQLYGNFAYPEPNCSCDQRGRNISCDRCKK